MKSLARYILIVLLSIVAGCATYPVLTDVEVSSRYPELSQFKNELNVANENGVDLLSTRLFRGATERYEEALISARTGNDSARKVVKQGKALLTQAITGSDITRGELSQVILARDRALSAGAEKKSVREFSEADKKLSELGDLVAEGRIADVREARLALAAKYAELEVLALQYTTEKQAQARIQEAKRLKAGDYAPQTYRQALSELKLASGVLESDADAQEKAASHAQAAFLSAGRAIQITEIIKEFKQSGMSDEQIVLWYQAQLSRAVAPVKNPDFSQPNRTVVSDLASHMQMLVTDARQNVQLMSQSKEQYAKVLASKDVESRRQGELDLRFRTVQNAFTKEEAEVYRQGDDVLIRAYGFSFPSGGSEIQSNNFPLLKKITSAIEQFPDSKVEISGHTDDRGSDALNLALSSDRAEKVAKFLVDVGNLSASAVTSIGRGKSNPLASNETSEGRADNRRVEVLIINSK